MRSPRGQGRDFIRVSRRAPLGSTYIGLDAIARRLAIHPDTVHDRAARGEFVPAYRRRIARRLTWFSTEVLILAWEADQARQAAAAFQRASTDRRHAATRRGQAPRPSARPAHGPSPYPGTARAGLAGARWLKRRLAILADAPQWEGQDAVNPS